MAAESDRPADFTVTHHGNLVAYVWRAPAQLARPHVVQMEHSAMVCFERPLAPVFVELAKKVSSTEAFVVEIGIEGYHVHPGERAPHAGMRGF